MKIGDVVYALKERRDWSQYQVHGIVKKITRQKLSKHTIYLVTIELADGEKEYVSRTREIGGVKTIMIRKTKFPCVPVFTTHADELTARLAMAEDIKRGDPCPYGGGGCRSICVYSMMVENACSRNAAYYGPRATGRKK
jgi:hypothetical protein